MSEVELRRRRVCFTGHRPDKISDESVVRSHLESAIDKAISNGFVTFISGMCPGVDIIAAEIVLDRRKSNPDIHLIAAMPYPRFAFNWDGWGERVHYVLSQADLIKNVSNSYTGRSVFQKRNIWMVDHSSRIIAYWNGTPGGTRNTVEYAKGRIELVNCF